MNALEIFDHLEAKAIAEATKRLRKLKNKELEVLWKHYKKSDNPWLRDDTIKELAIELVENGK